MTQPTTLAPNRTRTQLVVGIALFALLFLLGAQIVDPRISRRVVAAVVAITGIISGILPRPRHTTTANGTLACSCVRRLLGDHAGRAGANALPIISRMSRCG
jgi:hypothetical protein